LQSNFQLYLKASGEENLSEFPKTQDLQMPAESGLWQKRTQSWSKVTKLPYILQKQTLEGEKKTIGKNGK